MTMILKSDSSTTKHVLGKLATPFFRQQREGSVAATKAPTLASSSLSQRAAGANRMRLSSRPVVKSN
eukprot:833734-Pleurochrysis_carterae.AAC.1